MTSGRQRVNCSFCFKSQEQGPIAGPNVSICSDCVVFYTEAFKHGPMIRGPWATLGYSTGSGRAVILWRGALCGKSEITLGDGGLD